jgi:putative hydrolase of the HAD superfamily
MFDLIALDADDTLWRNEDFYGQARDRFRRLLAKYEVNGDVDERADTLEVANIEYYGYGVMSFILSLIEAAIDLTDGAFAAQDVQKLLDLGKEMLTADVQLLEHTETVVARVADRHPLIVITKGDLLHQRNKVKESGLRDYFRHVEVVSHKTPETYAEILTRHQVAPDRFLMVGNSLRSDVLPVLELGAWAVHVPHEKTWDHEIVEPPAEAGERFLEVEHLGQLPGLLAKLNDGR